MSMGWGVTLRALEHTHNAEQINRADAFFLVYGSEEVLPTDIIHDSPRVQAYDETEAEIARQDAVNLLEEERELVLQRSAIY